MTPFKKLLPISTILLPSLALGLDSKPTEPVIGRAPVIHKAVINLYEDNDGNGVPTVGDRLEAHLDNADVTDADGDISNAYQVFWYLEGRLIDPSGTDRHTILPIEAGKSITAKVVAFTNEETTDPAESEPFTATGGTADPDNSGAVEVPVNGAIVSVTIDGFVNGVPQVDSELTATANCQGRCPVLLDYQWQRESAIGSGTFENIPGETNSSYSPVGSDQRRRIKVDVSERQSGRAPFARPALR